ncbi:unnamed protein product [Miscanthus lutarioriparius]|uniref:Uncharacterized protein n=1 Tax=Miscanthus lutarioriparius TaxID=422564 RepID=A0A811R322_9POAL|nr:unnamed protein product [Miscanthus lutarioriparius]
MSKADFILTESAEVPGSGGSNWTDQETLLLLEALEIFKGKEWGEIAEHVATKTKEQCMLYFLQMPISEPFLDGEDFNETPQKITEQDSEIGPSDVPDEMDVDGNAEGKESTDEKAYKKANSISSETRTKLADQNVSAKEDTMDAVDHFLGQEDLGSFAEAGNPVMALAAFLSSLVEHDDAVSSCHSSLRAISEISPALQLATEHCFILPDPPSDLKDPTSTFSACTGSECQEGADTTQNKEHLELSDTKERGPEAEAKSNSTKDSDNPIAKVDSSVASDKIRDGCNANAISCSATSNSATEPSSIPSQEASAASTKDTTNPGQVEGDKPSSEELPADVSPSQGKIEPKKIEHAPAASSSVQQRERKQAGNGNTEEPKSNENIASDDDPIIRLQRAAGTAISAAAVKSKFLAEQEGYIRQLAAVVIEKQFQKIETKMSFLTDVENLVLRSRESTERMRKKLMLEQSMIIASRMGAAAAAASRTNQQGARGLDSQ